MWPFTDNLLPIHLVNKTFVSIYSLIWINQKLNKNTLTHTQSNCVYKNRTHIINKTLLIKINYCFPLWIFLPFVRLLISFVCTFFPLISCVSCECLCMHRKWCAKSHFLLQVCCCCRRRRRRSVGRHCALLLLWFYSVFLDVSTL